jgi:hypothetical protein
MSTDMRLHDSVALLEDTHTSHLDNGRPLVLRRGQIGTVVMVYDGGNFEVEFATRDGRAYAILPIAGDRLMVLHDSPEFATS